MAEARFEFICGVDDYLVLRTAQERWHELCAQIEDSFNCEIIDGHASVIAEVEAAVAQFSSAARTLPMFGGKKAVWFKNINFMGDGGLGRFEGTQEQIEALLATLEIINPEEVLVLLSACPVDRRKKHFKWLQTHSRYQFFENPKDEGAVLELLEAEAQRGGQFLHKGTGSALWSKVSGNLRLALGEIQKLCTYLHDEPETGITQDHVLTLVPHFGEGDNFEAAEAFYSLDLQWTLEAIHRYFFAGHPARMLLTSLQNRNRLCLQLKVLLDNGEISQSLNAAALSNLARKHGHLWQENSTKSAFNLTTQNPYYLSRLMRPLRQLSLKQLVQFQLEFVAAFQGTVDRKNEDEAVLREMAIRCLHG